MKKLFQGQKVLVMGLGLYGGGIAVVKWLVRQGAVVTVTDLKTRKDLEPSLKKLKNLPVKYVLGRHDQKDFAKADLVVQNPGVPRDSKYLKIARKKGIPIENDASLFFKYARGVIIGVTGTRGKSTTASLVHAILRKKYKVHLAGLPDQPIVGIIDRVNDDDLVVLELSSWQLEILGRQKLSPEVAVVTNIFPDHLNRYSSMASYIAAKKNIFKFQNHDDVAVLNAENKETKKMFKEVKSRLVKFSKKDFKNLANVSSLLGEHNQENLAAAIAVAKIFKVKNEDIKTAIKEFKSLPSRIELVAEKNGISFYNDTTSTTPDAAIAALNSFAKKNVILIAGGDTKNIPQEKYREFAKAIKRNCKAVVLMAGPGSEKIIKELNFSSLVTDVKAMPEAVSLAKSFAKAGDVILLSPGSASFNLFVNEYDRGDRFNKAVSVL